LLREHGLVEHKEDGRWRATGADLDHVAVELGLADATERQKARDRRATEAWGDWLEARRRAVPDEAARKAARLRRVTPGL
jgi:hypothetical protein